MKGQTCPVITDIPEHPQQYCGDWCPHFGEPHAGSLQICQGRKIVFNKFTDERKAKGVSLKVYTGPTEMETAEPVKKKRGRPRKVRLTDDEILKSAGVEDHIPGVEPVTYHNPCKTCRKSRLDDNGKYPPCTMPSFTTGSSGIETCSLWWEKEGRVAK